MELFISHQSALEFWRKSLANNTLAGRRLRANTLPRVLTNTQSFAYDKPFRLSDPLHIMIGCGNGRKVNRYLACHVDSRKFPYGSFVQVSPKIAVSSPELTFAQLAGELSLLELTVLGYEMCGGYRLDDEEITGRGFRDGTPLTSVEKLDSFTAKMTGLKGHRNARKALSHLVDGAASPMETVLTMLLTLPYSLGGYGFPKPIMNAPINTQIDAKNNKGRAQFYCDLYWPEEQVDVEYDSDAYHTGSERIFRDATRRNALSSVGVTVVTVSRRQVASTFELRKTAETLSKLLEKRLQCPEPKFTEKHAALRNMLMPSLNTFL